MPRRESRRRPHVALPQYPGLDGLRAGGASPAEPGSGMAAHYLNMRKMTIFGGSNEIQRNILAKTFLGL